MLARESKLADWKNARKLKFAVAGKSLAFTPKYHDLSDGEHTLPDGKTRVTRSELFIVEIPLAQARLIASAKSVVVNTEPKSVPISLTAAAHSGFKALVATVDSPPKAERKNPNPPARAPRKLEEDIATSATGLPVNEAAPIGLPTQITTPVIVGKDVIFVAAAVRIEMRDSQLKYPNVTLHFGAYGKNRRWGGAERVTLTYAGKSRVLEADASSKTQYDGEICDMLQVLLPYADFARLVESGQFTFTINKATFAVNETKSGGLRALLAKIKPAVPAPATN